MKPINEDEAEILINRLLDLEEEIKTDLQELLALATNAGPDEARP